MEFAQTDIVVEVVVIARYKSEQPSSADEECERWSKGLKKVSELRLFLSVSVLNMIL